MSDSSLTISPVQDEDHGNVTCTVESIAGQASAVAKLQVIGTIRNSHLCNSDRGFSRAVYRYFLYRRLAAIQLGFVSAQGSTPTTVCSTHENEIWRQSLNSLWPGQSYGTVFLQQFVKQTLSAR